MGLTKQTTYSMVFPPLASHILLWRMEPHSGEETWLRPGRDGVTLRSELELCELARRVRMGINNWYDNFFWRFSCLASLLASCVGDGDEGGAKWKIFLFVSLWILGSISSPFWVFSLDRAYVFKSELLEAITHEMKRMELGIWKTLNSHLIRIEPAPPTVLLQYSKNLHSMYI